MPSAGGPAARVSRNGGFTCQFSPDGKLLYYLKSRQNGGIWRLDLAAGTEQPVIPEMASRNWKVLHDGIYMLDAKRSSVSANNGVSPGEALYYPFATGRVEKLGFTTPKPIGVQGIDLSPDQKWVYYSQADSQGSDLVIVENLPVR